MNNSGIYNYNLADPHNSISGIQAIQPDPILTKEASGFQQG